MLLSVFTEKYDRKVNRLINNALIDMGDNKPLSVTAQWDTGATGTCVSHNVVEKLGLKPYGMQQVQTPSGRTTLNRYKINLVINEEVVINNLSVLDSEIGNQGIDVLIGMDVIGYGDFAISNFENTTQFSFRIPSQEHIDFEDN